MPSVEGNGAAVDFRGAVTKSEDVVWGQVVVALRDDDTVRRRRADAEASPAAFRAVVGGEPSTPHTLTKDMPPLSKDGLE